jgi:hypothetical protein
VIRDVQEKVPMRFQLLVNRSENLPHIIQIVVITVVSVYCPTLYVVWGTEKEQINGLVTDFIIHTSRVITRISSISGVVEEYLNVLLYKGRCLMILSRHCIGALPVGIRKITESLLAYIFPV